ncbi:endonuclease/exonuclease/phosphatase family protein [Mangrovimonas aestuarii]|uniref:endonuclease/exonuclease/phosphatase family protein n=1 Tax=Mangrovimonas aestuarii TaxID=3018443 RepID=UPI0023793878|nr:endonuclease/exonuclease/phosphatase family protein [Mangrovimonas aestuarii]
MKKLNFIDKLIFVLNSIVATLLLFSYVLPFLPPKTFAVLSVLSLGVPLLILINVLFFLYWLLKVKRQMILSLLVLLLGYASFGSVYKFSATKQLANEYQLSIMNYNVRLFNVYEWIAEDGIETKLVDFVKKQNPDVLTLQEYHPREHVDFSFFKYKFEKLSGNKVKSGQAIFSKYPIINSGSIEFPNTSNNAIFADIVKGDDTIRVYNVHLQSLKINADVNALKKTDSERLLQRVGNTFKMQQKQTELFVKHKAECPYKMIISGDFNNTAYSYVYKEVKGDMVDTYKMAGNGFGRTYDFKFFPVRIDFILSDKAFQISDFKTYDELYSDHYPIMATVNLKVE